MNIIKINKNQSFQIGFLILFSKKELCISSKFSSILKILGSLYFLSIMLIIMGLSNCGLDSAQTSNQDLRVMLDNFLNSGVTTEFGTVMA